MVKQVKAPAAKAPGVTRKPAKPVKPVRLAANTIICPKSTTPPQLCSSTTLHVCGTYNSTIKDVTVEIRNQGDTAAVPNGGLQHAALAGGRLSATFHKLPATVGAAAFDRVKVCWYEAGGILATQDTVRIRVGPQGTDCAASCALPPGRKRKAPGLAAP